jgi:hypothetical protein
MSRSLGDRVAHSASVISPLTSCPPLHRAERPVHDASFRWAVGVPKQPGGCVVCKSGLQRLPRLLRQLDERGLVKMEEQ